jgi:hypothetical protein
MAQQMAGITAESCPFSANCAGDMHLSGHDHIREYVAGTRRGTLQVRWNHVQILRALLRLRSF